MSILNQAGLLSQKAIVQQIINSEIDPQTPPDSITAQELNGVLTAMNNLLESSIQSTYNVVNKIPITEIYQGSLANTLDIILQEYQPLITPINTAFNKNFGVGGNSLDIPRFDDPRFTDQRVPVNNSVTTIKIQDNAVDNAKIADMPTLTLKGNNTGVIGNPLDLTTTQVRAMLNVQDGAQVNYTAKNSITLDSLQYQLVNDSATPGNFYYYGTNNAGAKGYFTLESAITNYVLDLDGDDWGDQVVAITPNTVNPTTSGSFTLLNGNGLGPFPLSINGTGLRDFVTNVVGTLSLGDNWGTQVVQLASGSGLLGDGLIGSELRLDIKSNESIGGVGTVASPLVVEENWLTNFISDYITANQADDWGSQVAETSGLITGNGLANNKIRLTNGDPTKNQLVLWDFVTNNHKYVDTAEFSVQFLNVTTSSPLQGTGKVSSPIRLIDGLAEGNILYWVNGAPGNWAQVNLPTVIANNNTASNGLTKTGVDTRLGGTLTQATNINTAGNDLNLNYTGLPTAFVGDSQISKFGYSLNATHDTSRPLLGLTSGNYSDYTTSIGDYIYTYAGIEYTNGNTFTIASLNKTAGVQTSVSKLALSNTSWSLSIDGTIDNTLVSNQDGLTYSSSNDLGIRYTGFGETDINTMGAVNYAALQFNSLVPKKYVDDRVIVETALATIQTPATTELDKYVSARRFWSGIDTLKASTNTWTAKNTFDIVQVDQIHTLKQTFTLTGASPSQVINLNNGSYSVLNLTGASGTATISLTNGQVGSSYFIQVIQAATSVDVNFVNEGRFDGLTGNTIVSANNVNYCIVAFFTGTGYLVNTATLT